MKSNLVVAKKNSEGAVSCTTRTTQRVNKLESPATAGVPKHFRLLKWNEVVRLGDFVADEHQGFEPWKGPAGFRADAFVKPIYRRDEGCSTAAKRPK